MPNYDLGTARGVITLGYRDGGAVSRATGDLDRFHNKGKLVGTVVKGALVGVAGAAAIVAGGLALAVKSASDFQAGMSNIKAVSGATEQQMEAVRAKALQLGKDTKFSAGEAASAIEELAKAGISLPDILNGAADATVNLAAAGGVALPEAATIASNAMNQFQLRAQDMPRIADLIAGAANASAIDVHQFGYSLAQAGAVAKLAGLSFADTAVAIAEMGNAGIVGSDAGTSLKSFLQNLIPTTQKQISLFRELGLEQYNSAKASQVLEGLGIKPLTNSIHDQQQALMRYAAEQAKAPEGSQKAIAAYVKLTQSMGIMNNEFFDAQGNTKKLADIQQVLQNAMKGLTKEQQLNALQTLFGSDAIRAASIMAQNGAAGYDKLAGSMDKVKAADVAKTKMDNLKGSTEQLKGSVETLAISVGTYLLPALKTAADTANGFVGYLIDASENIPALAARVHDLAVNGLDILVRAWHSEDVQRFVTSIVRLAAVLAGPLSSSLPLIIATARILAILIGVTLLIAFRLLSYAALALANTAEFISRNWSQVRAILLGLLVVLSPVIALLIVQFGILGVVAVLAGVRMVIAWVQSAAAAVASGAIMYVNTLRIIGQWIAMGAASLVSAGQFVVSIAIIIGNYIALGVAAALSAARVVAGWVLTGLAALASAAQAVVAFGIIVAGWILMGVQALLQAARIALAWIIAFGPIALIVIAVVALTILIITHWRQIAAFLTSIMATIWHAMVAAWHAVSSAVMDAVDFVVGFVRAHWQLLVAMLLGPLAVIVLGVIKHWQQIKDTFNQGIGFIKGIPGKIKSALGNLGGLLKDAGRAVIQGLIDGIEGMLGNLYGKVGAIAGKIKSLKGPIDKDKTLLVDEGGAIMLSLINGLNAFYPMLLRTIGHINSDLGSVGSPIVDLSNRSKPSGFTANPDIGGAAPKVVAYNYHTALHVDMSEVDEVGKLVGVINGIPQASRAGVGGTDF